MDSHFRRIALAPPAVLGTAVTGLALLTALAPGRSLGQYTLGSVLVALIGALLVVAIHEIGHALAGWLVGFRFAVLLIGPVWIDPAADGRLRVRPNTAWWLLGMAVCVPRDARALRRRQMIFMLGGPLTSAITGAAALCLQGKMGGPVQTWVFETGQRGLPELLTVHFLFFFGWISWFMSAINLLPRAWPDFRTDGAWLVALVRRGPAASIELALSSARLAAEYSHNPIWRDQMYAFQTTFRTTDAVG
ncbi:MAG: M50 family metallopeptidase [Anaerolineae bacterium]|nr:M50 family metallopeptidase [Anaerolineae bacterium]